MSKRRLVDTNLIVRHLVQDHEAHAKAAGRLFEACDRGDVILVVLPAVVAEAVFVLESFYRHSRIDIARVLGNLLASPNIELTDEAIHQAALVEYSKSKLHFVDCELAAYARAGGLAVATLDQGFRKLPGIMIKID